ncbi:glycerophosphodiester phosphodiesterase [Lacinutrix chionoecetis]
MKQLYPLKFGHRGAKGYITENTIASITKALSLGVDGIEIDVHKCKSGELIVFHDFTLNRVTNGTGKVSEFTLKQLKALTVQAGYKIPTLKEVCNVIDKRCILNIELKGENTAKETVKTIQEYIIKKEWKYSNIIVSSFNYEALTSANNFDSNIPIGVLTEDNIEAAIIFAKEIKAQAIHPDFNLLNEENVKKIKKEGFKINTWTVNKPEDIKRMKQYKVHAIISDYPDRL